MGRKYTGWDGDASGKRAGNDRFIDYVTYLTGNGLWNNGSWGPRSKRGKSSPSVHGTGRATDFSWRRMPNGKGYSDYAKACEFIDLLVANADLLQIECVFDYYPGKYGRGWKCDREAWQVYSRKAFSGAPGGDWFHCEIAPGVADDPGHFDRAFATIMAGCKPAEAQEKPVEAPQKAATPKVATGRRPYPGEVLRRGSRGEDVAWMQAIVGTKADGDFGPVTERAVRRWQSRNGLAVDGIVGPKTWQRLVLAAR